MSDTSRDYVVRAIASPSGDLVASPNPWASLARQRLALFDSVNSRNAELAHVKQEMHDAELATSLLRRRYNALLPISRLPAEILSLVFLETREDIETRHYSTTARALPHEVSLTHVSYSWRSIALSCAAMWAHIPFSMGEAWSLVFAERAKTAALSIPPMLGFARPSWRYDFVNSKFSKIRRLDVLTAVGSDIAAVLDILASCIPEQLVALILKYKIFDDMDVGAVVIHPAPRLLYRAPRLQEIELHSVVFPWDALPWTQLRKVHITATLPNSVMTNLALLVASLASTTVLEELSLSMSKCAFDAAVPSQRGAVQLPNLTLFKFDGCAADFTLLSCAIQMPLTMKLDISLQSDHRGAAKASAVSALLRAHIEHNERHIQALRISTAGERHPIRLQIWSSVADCAATIRTDMRLIEIALHLPNEGAQALDLEANLLCQNIIAKRLRQLEISLNTTDGEEGPARDITTPCLFLASAYAVECLHINGPYHNALFQVLITQTPAATAGAQAETRSSVLFPALQHLHLTGFHEPYFSHYHSLSLPEWIDERARHAPIATLYLKHSSVEEQTIKQLRAMPGLKLEWDGSLGDCAEDSEDPDVE